MLPGGGPERLGEVRHADPVPLDVQVQGVAAGVELLQDRLALSRTPPPSTPLGSRPVSSKGQALRGNYGLGSLGVGALARDGHGVGLRPEADEYRRAEPAVTRPPVEPDGRDDLRAHPARRLLVDGLGIGEGRGGRLEGAKLLRQALQHRAVEPAAHRAAVGETRVGVVPEDERAERRGTLAQALGVPADDELLGLGVLCLQPVPAPDAGLVGAVPLLGDEALQPRLPCGLEEGLALGLHMVDDLE